MRLRCLLVPLVLGTLLSAADQTPPPSSQSAPAAKPDEPKTSSRPHLRFGGFILGAGYSYFSGGYPYYYYDPLYYPALSYQPGMGQVKIQATDKSSMVYLNGALAGPVDKFKNMWLDPGTYQLELRTPGWHLTQKIYVLSGKTLRVSPNMMVGEAQP